jgi:hypothetical protein
MIEKEQPRPANDQADDYADLPGTLTRTPTPTARHLGITTTSA